MNDFFISGRDAALLASVPTKKRWHLNFDRSTQKLQVFSMQFTPLHFCG